MSTMLWNLVTPAVDMMMANANWLGPGPEYACNASKALALSTLDWTKDPTFVCSPKPRQFDHNQVVLSKMDGITRVRLSNGANGANGNIHSVNDINCTNGC